MRWIFGLLFALTGLVTAQAETHGKPGAIPPPDKDRWHVVAEGSPFFSADMAGLRIAAVLQEDGNFARLVLGAEGQGAYVTVALPGQSPAASLRSELIYGNGARLTRDIADSALDTLRMPGPEMVIYSFSVAPGDISAFRRAARWVLTPAGGDPATITLDGSADAIAEARTRGAPAAEETPEDRPMLTGLPTETD